MSAFRPEDLGLQVSFSLKSGGVIPLTYENVKLEAISHGGGLLQYNPKALHEALTGVISDIGSLKYTDYMYYLFRNSDGTQFIIGEPWISIPSIVRESSAYLNIKVIGAGSANIEPIRRLLASRNYSNTVITVHGDDLP